MVLADQINCVLQQFLIIFLLLIMFSSYLQVAIFYNLQNRYLLSFRLIYECQRIRYYVFQI
nr:MAG TPA: hypothetical protein [Caudoviricetes sp.]